MITVRNVRKDGRPVHPWQVYIGRACYGFEQSPLFNAHRRGTRDQNVEWYRADFESWLAEAEEARSVSADELESYFETCSPAGRAWQALEELDRLRSLLKEHGQLELFCWCAPLACHGDVIKAHLGKEV